MCLILGHNLVVTSSNRNNPLKIRSLRRAFLCFLGLRQFLKFKVRLKGTISESRVDMQNATIQRNINIKDALKRQRVEKYAPY